jgi:hypothetical protein
MRVNLMLAAAFGLGCVSLFFLTPSSSGQQAHSTETGDAAEQNEDEAVEMGDPSKPGSFWMDQKLRLSKEILSGLARADFEALGKNAERIRGLNRVEKFVRRGPEGYRDLLRQFNMANNALIRAAQEENLEGATLAFNQMTISCVNCHRHLRENE